MQRCPPQVYASRRGRPPRHGSCSGRARAGCVRSRTAPGRGVRSRPVNWPGRYRSARSARATRCRRRGVCRAVMSHCMMRAGKVRQSLRFGSLRSRRLWGVRRRRSGAKDAEDKQEYCSGPNARQPHQNDIPSTFEICTARPPVSGALRAAGPACASLAHHGPAIFGFRPRGGFHFPSAYPISTGWPSQGERDPLPGHCLLPTITRKT